MNVFVSTLLGNFPNVTVWGFWLDLITGEKCEETWKVYGSLYGGDGSCGWLNMLLHVTHGSGACVCTVGGVFHLVYVCAIISLM